jgi:pyruvate kinase
MKQLQNRNRKAKIVATLGPSCETEIMIDKLFLAGVDVFRLNFSHGSHEDHKTKVKIIRKLEKKYARYICILGDLQGPKFRVGKFKNTKETLKKGQEFIFDTNKADGDSKRVYLSHKEIYQSISKGQRLLVNDGKIRLVVKSTSKNKIKCSVTAGGEISNNKGLNIPDTKLKLKIITPKDKLDLALAIKLDVDWIALSFIQTNKDLMYAKKLIPSKFKVMVKVEKPSAMDELESITANSDGIMVARGDLGVETNPEDVPIHQRTMVAECRKQGKPCIVATQMLESMIDSPTPTRAEASDVATAIFQGVDAVMLSAESAAGQYPIESVQMMNKIIKRVEGDEKYKNNLSNYNLSHTKNTAEAIARAAFSVAEIIESNCLVTFSKSGRSIVRVSRMRPDVTLLGLTSDVKVARQNALTWGTLMDVVDDVSTSTEMVDRACRIVKKYNIVPAGSQIIITAGVPFGRVGSTNLMRIATIIKDNKLT